jgi:hypothetical protein
MRPFFAFVEKQGPCELEVKPALDGTPFLCAMPTESASQVNVLSLSHLMRRLIQLSYPQDFHGEIDLNSACVRSTKNVRGDFKVCSQRAFLDFSRLS